MSTPTTNTDATFPTALHIKTPPLVGTSCYSGANNGRKITFADFFSGIGALRLGFEQACRDAGLVPRCAHSCEIDEKAAAVYRRHFNDLDPLGDIRAIADGHADLPTCDLLLAGFPCPAFSACGPQLGFDDERGRLFFSLARTIQRGLPRAFFLENVKGLVSHNKGSTLRTVLDTLTGLGYSIFHAVLNSRNFGVPQHRERIYIVGFLGNMEGFQFPAPTDPTKRLIDILEPEPVDPRYYLSEQYLEAIRQHKAEQEAKGRGYGYEILDPDRDVANTLVCGGMGRERNLIVDTRITEFPILARRRTPLSRECVRNLTPREWERLQGLPTGWTDGQADSHRYRQLGNAVSVPVIRAISRNILASLEHPDTTPRATASHSISTESTSACEVSSGADSPSAPLRGPDDCQTGLANTGKCLRFADLFCGIGGFRMALERLGGRCVFSSEIDPHARSVYRANFGEDPSGDICAIKGEDIPEHDILCGGFPCPSWSGAGKQQGFADDRGKLFFEIVRILRERQPSVVFLENVSNLVRHSKGESFATIRKLLEDCGYTVFWKILNASHYGVPTSRRRVYIVCFRNDLGISDFAFPAATMENVCLADALLPDAETDDCVILDQPVHIYKNAARHTRGQAHLRTIRIGHLGNKQPAGQGYRIYSPLGHAITLCALAGGMGAKTGLYLINGRVRRLHPRECLRTMGFDDSFMIPSHVSPEQVRKMAGNSVAVPVVQMIGAEIVRVLGRVDPTTGPGPSGGAPTESATTCAASSNSESSPSATQVIVASDAEAASDRVSASPACSVVLRPDSESLVGLDLFAGCGGFSTGFDPAEGYEIVAACEWDPEHPAIAETYGVNHPGTQMVHADITLEATKLAICRLFEHRRCEVIIGGPPCAAYSMSGKRDPNDPRGLLFEHYAHMVGRLNPLAVIMENVVGMLSARRGEDLPVIDSVVAVFQKLGYSVQYQVLNSADYGVPQERRRVIIIAARPGIPIVFPAPTHSKYGSLADGMLPWVTVRDAIDDIADAPEDKEWWHVHVRSCPEFLERIRRTQPGESALGYSEVFQRLWADRPACTIKGSHGGVPIHHSRDRLITPREMARLQSFPDSYRFLGNKHDVLLMLSNAVPCGLSRALACSIRAMLQHRRITTADKSPARRL